MVHRSASKVLGSFKSHSRSGLRLESNRSLAKVFLMDLFCLSIAPLDYG